MAISSQQPGENALAQEKLNPISESERWAEQAERGLLGTSAGLTGEALKKFNLLYTYPAMSNERNYIKSMLRGFARGVFETFANRLEQGEKARQEAQEKLAIFRRESQEMLETMGRNIRAKGGFAEVAEESEILAIGGFVDSLRQVETVDAVVDVLDQDQGFLRMLAEVNGIPAPDAEDSSDMRVDISGQTLLDPDRPATYKQNILALKVFIRGTQKDSKDKGYDVARKKLETAIWADIVRKMSEPQRIDLLKTFYGDGDKGIKQAEEFVEVCVTAGVFSDQDAVRLLQNPILAKNLEGGSIGIDVSPGSKYTKRLKKARDDFNKAQAAIAGAVQYLDKTAHGNAILGNFTYEKAIWNYVVFNAGAVGLGGTILVEVGSKLRGQKTWTGRIQAIGEAVLSIAQNPVAYLDAALVGASVDAVTGGLGKGAVSRALLYSPSGKQKESDAEEHVISELGTVLSNHPGMSDFVYGRYEYLVEQARMNESAGRGFRLSKTDIALIDQDLAKWHFSVDDAGRADALKALNSVVEKLSRGLKKDDADAVGAFLDEKGFAYDKNVYPERQAKIADLKHKLDEYPGMASFIARNYDVIQAAWSKRDIEFTGFTLGVRFEFDKLLTQYGKRTKDEKLVVSQDMLAIVETLNDDFEIDKKAQVKNFFAAYEFIPKTFAT